MGRVWGVVVPTLSQGGLQDWVFIRINSLWIIKYF